MSFHPVVPILRSFDEGKVREFYVDWLGFHVDWERRLDTPHDHTGSEATADRLPLG